ncbi:MAG TPA: HD domain-containing protein [Piscinibacter sp.]|jgi:putative two-component system response regulator|uniref:HD-GYP domain-containing protein n=1 Tax=Piscinibacter sp. TaxID=1903157 RepID=UPI0025D1CF9A|nr:HD domain-containing phosphohydrolase [Piscinibacter sp.]HNW64777.1 HD domain-containing protein [Piscinibacter sp.]HPG80672.1 HD domain-containing protein [Piscinibacter sp.]HPM68578.1 HD domain-containing protein [Piscinibacter sp.]
MDMPMADLHAAGAPAALGLADPAMAQAQLERVITDLGRVYRERNDALRALARAHHEALLRLSIAAEFRDDDTGVHIVRMGFLAEALALALGQNAAWSKLLRMAAPMHDIGKIGVPDNVLKKPGPLTREEREVMNRHAQMGADILGASEVPLFKLASEVALSHHERFDGSGYPRGLAGAAIPLSGRIVAAVDYFDALTMDRCYRPAIQDKQALEMMAGERGRLFDPVVVDIFLDRADDMVALRDRINSHRPQFSALLDDEPLGAAVT